MKYHDCPSCSAPTKARHVQERQFHQDAWFICKCGHAFRTLANRWGRDARVIAQSPLPHEVKVKAPADDRVFQFTCPTCGGTHSWIKSTERRGDDLYRRHKCRTCESMFVSRVNKDGMGIMRHMPSKVAVEA